MDSKIKKCCPKCCQYYHLKLPGSKSEYGNIPLFLSCGHSICSNCIRTIIKCEEFIECPICGQDIHISTSNQAMRCLNKDAFHELFPVNVNMLGELALQNIEPKSGQTNHDDEYFLNITELIRITESAQGECVECHEPTSKMCKQCGIIVCLNCFSKSHKNFIIFKNHALQDIDFQLENTTCGTHKSRPLDYYCTNCAKAICMDCLMVGGEMSCKNHDVTSIQEVNKAMLAELSEITPKVDENFRRLTKTAVDIGHRLMRLDDENNSSAFRKLVNQVEQHYSKLNAAIQKQKKQIIDEIIKFKYNEIESLNEAKYNIAESIQKAKHTLNTINSIDTNKLTEVNMSAILKDAKEIVNIPWYLNRNEADAHLQLKVDEDIIAAIHNYVQLDGTGNTTYSLCTTQVLSDRHEDIPAAPSTVVYPPEIVKDVRQLNKAKAEKENIKPSSFIKKVPQYRSKMGSCTSLNSITSDTSHKSYPSYDQKPIVSPFPENQYPKQILEGSQELIYISHIVDPHNFYVQRVCHQSSVKELLREFRNAVSMPKPSVNHVAEGKVYLVLNKADNLWQRCRVMTIDRRNLNKPLYRVFCVDFGSTELVTIDKLRLLPPARIKSPPPFAIKCCLANCEPINGAWTSDDSILIQNIIDNKQAVLHVRRVRSSTEGTVTMECDVNTVEDGLSVAHALAFHGRARMSNALKYPKMIGIVEKPKLFISNNDFKLNDVEEVYITHVVSPDHFYVRKEHLQSVYEKLCEDLDQEYSSNSNADSIYLPEKDMSCAVWCGRWRRAVVGEVRGRGRVVLALVDSGALHSAHWTALRRLRPRHATLRALATECHLAGVTPLNKKWSPGSVALLQKFEDKLLELHVEDNRNRNSLGVTLYDKSDEDNVVCVNTLMIKYKFAVTFGLFMFNKNSEIDDLVITNKSPPDESKPAPKNEKPVAILKRDEIKIKTPKEEDLKAKDKGPLRLEAKILNCQSPSLVYVSLVHQQKIFNELFEKIQKYYSKKTAQSKHVWNVGDRCCTLCVQSQTWRRAAILEVNEGDAKVFYSDFACVETVPLVSLRELPQEFASIGDAAIMCHLCGIIPAFGEEWPSLTKEYLNELLDAYKRVFITKLGKFKGKSMPVELWVYHTIQGGALEPNKSEWRCLNKKIIEQGLGIPDKSEETTSEISSNAGDDMLSFLNITGSVRDWLQIEPMPLKPLQIKSGSDSHSSTSTPVEADAKRTEEDLPNSNTVFISDWLPPEPLPNNEFTAMPTYTDNDGVIYLHDIAQQDTLDLIRKALDVRFKNPDPKAKFVKWSVGEPCIALYFLDNCFYRGRILAVNKDDSNCLVHYIDYGNDEICEFENLRKSIALYQIPTQAHKCILNRIQPIGKKWDRTTLDYIHKSIVEKQCLIRISGELIGDLVPVDIKYDRLWINDHLVEFEMARYTDGSEAVVRKYAPNIDSNKKLETTIDTDSGPDYIIEYDPTDTSTSQDSVQISSLEGKDWNELIELDENNIDGKFITYASNNETEFLCTITVLNEFNKLELNIIHDEEISKIYEEMYEELQADSCDMVALNGIFENKACIALFPEDGRWYRASILEYSKTSNRIKVKYIDYGNIKVLSLFDVKEISDKFTKLPPANVTATLYGVKINPDIDMTSLNERFEETFLDKEPFLAKVIVNGSVPSVELSQDDKLIYEDLQLDNIFLLSD